MCCLLFGVLIFVRYPRFFCLLCFVVFVVCCLFLLSVVIRLLSVIRFFVDNYFGVCSCLLAFVRGVLLFVVVVLFEYVVLVPWFVVVFCALFFVG